MNTAYLPPITSDVVLDLSHYDNVNQSFSKAIAAGIVAVILKATQGTGFVDPTFFERATAAKAAGLRVGAYHFLDSSDPAQQMTQFLSIAKSVVGMNLLALDFEPYPQSNPTVSIAAGAASILHTRVGRYPVLYTIRTMIPAPSQMLSNCPLWLAEWGSSPVPPPGFAEWKLWQYTDSGVVDGIGVCDRSKFAGTVDELKLWWANAGMG